MILKSVYIFIEEMNQNYFLLFPEITFRIRKAEKIDIYIKFLENIQIIKIKLLDNF